MKIVFFHNIVHPNLDDFLKLLPLKFSSRTNRPQTIFTSREMEKDLAESINLRINFQSRIMLNSFAAVFMHKFNVPMEIGRKFYRWGNKKVSRFSRFRLVGLFG